MCVHNIKNPVESTEKLFKLISSTGYKISIQKSIVVLYTSNEQFKAKLRRVEFTVVLKRKYLGINWQKCKALYLENYKTSLKERRPE